MIRAAVLATLLFTSSALQAARDDARDEARQSRRHHDLRLGLPALPGVPDLDFSGMEIDLRELAGDLSGMEKQLHGLLADSRSLGWDADDEDDDSDEEAGPDRDGNGRAKVYKMNPQGGVRFPRVHLGDDDRDFDEREATAQAKGRGSATMDVKGPVTFQLRAQAGDVEVVATDRQKVSVTLTDSTPEEIALFAFGDRIEPSFRGRRTLRRGKLRVELPRGSRLDLASMSGNVTAQKIGDVRIRSMSGDVKLSGTGKADVQTISGDVRIEDAAGPVRLHTVSGHAAVTTAGAAPQVEFQSASGSFEWAGVCAKDCHLSAETVSGEVQLAVDQRSSFELSYTSHSGELRDEVNLAVKRSPRRKHGFMSSGWLEASYGKGEGVIEADAFSGTLVIKKR